MNTFRDKIIFPTSAATYCSAFLAYFPVCLYRHRWVLDPAWYLQKRTMSQLSRKFYLYLPSGLCRGWGRSYMFRWVWSQFCQMIYRPWWRHQMETFSALLAICAGNSPVTVEFPVQRPVTRSFDVFFDLCLKKRLSKQWWGWWFEPPSHPLWRHCNDYRIFMEETACDNVQHLYQSIVPMMPWHENAFRITDHLMVLYNHNKFDKMKTPCRIIWEAHHLLD